MCTVVVRCSVGCPRQPHLILVMGWDDGTKASGRMSQAVPSHPSGGWDDASGGDGVISQAVTSGAKELRAHRKCVSQMFHSSSLVPRLMWRK